MAKASRKSRPLITLADPAVTTTESRRLILADYLRLVGSRIVGRPIAGPSPNVLNRPNLKTARSAGETPAAESPDATESHDPLANLNLSPRLQQTLDRLLAGDSEKQIAGRLGISPHTVHTYVKQLHKLLSASSRGELLSKFVRRS